MSQSSDTRRDGITTEEFQTLYAEQSTRLLRIAFLIAGNLTVAEDAVAETSTNCWRQSCSSAAVDEPIP